MLNLFQDENTLKGTVKMIAADQLIATSQSSDILFRAPDGTFLASLDVSECGGLPKETFLFSADISLDLPSGQQMVFKSVDMRCEQPKTADSARRIYFSIPNTHDIYRQDYIGSRVVLKNFAQPSAESKFHKFSISI